MLACPAELAAGVAGLGQATMGAGLLVAVAGPAGQGQCAAMTSAGLLGWPVADQASPVPFRASAWPPGSPIAVNRASAC